MQAVRKRKKLNPLEVEDTEGICSKNATLDQQLNALMTCTSGNYHYMRHEDLLLCRLQFGSTE
jgi:hypothetical protein